MLQLTLTYHMVCRGRRREDEGGMEDGGGGNGMKTHNSNTITTSNSGNVRHTSNIQVKLVLGFEDLDVQFAVWSIFLECPGTHDCVLILGESRRSKRREGGGEGGRRKNSGGRRKR